LCHDVDVLKDVAFGIMACGITFMIITGGFDLSVGSTAALTGVVVAFILKRYPDALLGYLAKKICTQKTLQQFVDPIQDSDLYNIVPKYRTYFYILKLLY